MLQWNSTGPDVSLEIIHWSPLSYIIPRRRAARVSRVNCRINISPPREPELSGIAERSVRPQKVSRKPSWLHLVKRQRVLLVLLVTPLIAGSPEYRVSFSNAPTGWARVISNVSPATCRRIRRALVSTKNDSERGKLNHLDIKLNHLDKMNCWTWSLTFFPEKRFDR